ncbi:MAG: hypothetical protein ACRDKB_13950 [Actinomycetota bacterium]
MALGAGSRWWMFSTDSMSWVRPEEVVVDAEGVDDDGREWAHVTLSVRGPVLIAGHRTRTLDRPEEGKPTYVDLWHDRSASSGVLPSNPDEWVELYSTQDDAQAVARRVVGNDT